MCSGYGCQDHFLECQSLQFLRRRLVRRRVSACAVAHSSIFISSADTQLHAWEVLVKIIQSPQAADIIIDVGMYVPSQPASHFSCPSHDLLIVALYAMRWG